MSGLGSQNVFSLGDQLHQGRVPTGGRGPQPPHQEQKINSKINIQKVEMSVPLVLFTNLFVQHMKKNKNVKKLRDLHFTPACFYERTFLIFFVITRATIGILITTIATRGIKYIYM